MSELEQLVEDMVVGYAEIIVDKVQKIKCCNRPEHRFSPESSSDWAAIDNAIAACSFMSHTEAVRMITSMYDTIKKLLKIQSKQLSAERVKELAMMATKMNANHAVVSAHFDLVAGKDKMTMDAAKHYDNVLNAIRGLKGEGKEEFKEFEDFCKRSDVGTKH